MKYFIIILSHKNSLFREIQRSELLKNNNSNIIFYYFIGDLSISDDYKVDDTKNIVYLKVPDNYESLSKKTYHAMKFVRENFYNEIKGVFKTDDDTELDLNKLYNCFEKNSDKKYYGIVNKINDFKSSYHFGKCEDKEINKQLITVPKCVYCSGGGYYINKILIDKLISSDLYNNIIYEDVFVGCSLEIEPEYINIKENGAYWDDDIFNK